MSFNIEEMQKGVAGNFANIRKTHAEKGLPVIISEKGRVIELYINDTKIDVTDKYKNKLKAANKDNGNELSF